MPSDVANFTELKKISRKWERGEGRGGGSSLSEQRNIKAEKRKHQDSTENYTLQHVNSMFSAYIPKDKGQ